MSSPASPKAARWRCRWGCADTIVATAPLPLDPVINTVVAPEWRRLITDGLGLMVLAPAAFFLIGAFIWVIRSFKTEQVEEEFHVGALLEPGHEGHIR